MKDVSYILPLRRSGGAPPAELSTYLGWLGERLDVVVVDGSPPPVFDAHADAWDGLGLRHVRPDPDVKVLNRKVAGVLTGLRLACGERVVIADDDVRYDDAALRRVVSLLDHAELVRPQNFFDPCPWHARWDCARTLLNRALGGDYPGTLAVRRAAVPAGYDGDVLFENLELIRTVQAQGGRMVTPLDCYVRRLPCSARHFWSQRVRQAYDDFAQPPRLAVALSVVPVTVRWALAAPVAADGGRRRNRCCGGRSRTAAGGRTPHLPSVRQPVRSGVAGGTGPVLVDGGGQPAPTGRLPLPRHSDPPGGFVLPTDDCSQPAPPGDSILADLGTAAAMTKPKASRTAAAKTPRKAPSTKKAAAAATGPRSSDGATGAAVRDEALRPSWAQAGDRLTTAQGVRVEDTDNTLRAGSRGPALLEDFHFREKIMHFDHERIPERAVHARGAAAHGEFVLYESMSDVTCARFLCDTATPTPVFLRFSTVVGSRGSADTARDVRGFSTRFYTPEGNFDLVGNNIPVFFIQDAIKFPDLIHAAKPEPDREIPQAQTAHSTFWDFMSLQPESTHMLMWAMSDRAIPRSYRTMEGFGVHTFRLVNESGETTLVKFHWKPAAGIHGLVWEEAQKLGGIDPDFHRRDLAEAIEAGAFPEWELGLQLLPDSDDQFFEGIDLLDPTKIVPEELAPVRLVGKLTLNRNPVELLRRDRTGGVPPRPSRAGHRSD